MKRFWLHGAKLGEVWRYMKVKATHMNKIYFLFSITLEAKAAQLIYQIMHPQNDTLLKTSISIL